MVASTDGKDILVTTRRDYSLESKKQIGLANMIQRVETCAVRGKENHKPNSFLRNVVEIEIKELTQCLGVMANRILVISASTKWQRGQRG